MEDILPVLATALAAVIGGLTKRWWEQHEKKKLLSSVKASSPEPVPGTNGWTNFATMIVTNLQREKEAQRAAYEAKIEELEFEGDEKDHTIQQLRAYVRTLREEAKSTLPFG